MSIASAITKSIKSFSKAVKIRAVAASMGTLKSVKADFVRAKSVFQALNAARKGVPVTQVAKQMTKVPEMSIVATTKAMKGKKIPAGDIVAVNKIAKASGDVADAATQKAIVKTLKEGKELTPALKKKWVKFAIPGGIILAMVAVVLAVGLTTLAKVDKARLTVTSITNVEKLDEKLAGILEYFEKGENMAALDTKKIPPPTKEWHLIRINFRYPDGEDEEDEDFEISVGHEVETGGTKSSPSIDQTRYMVMDSGNRYVVVAVPFKLDERASEGGTITIHYNLDYEMAKLIQNMEDSAELEPGPGEGGDDEDGDGADTSDGILSKNPLQDINWGWLVIGGIVLMVAMLMVSMTSRARARPV